jgi:hypothetical protein
MKFSGTHLLVARVVTLKRAEMTSRQMRKFDKQQAVKRVIKLHRIVECRLQICPQGLTTSANKTCRTWGQPPNVSCLATLRPRPELSNLPQRNSVQTCERYAVTLRSYVAAECSSLDAALREPVHRGIYHQPVMLPLVRHGWGECRRSYSLIYMTMRVFLTHGQSKWFFLRLIYDAV